MLEEILGYGGRGKITTSAQIVNGVVTGDDLADCTITGCKVADDTITLDKLHPEVCDCNYLLYNDNGCLEWTPASDIVCSICCGSLDGCVITCGTLHPSAIYDCGCETGFLTTTGDGVGWTCLDYDPGSEGLSQVLLSCNCEDDFGLHGDSALTFDPICQSLQVHMLKMDDCGITIVPCGPGIEIWDCSGITLWSCGCVTVCSGHVTIGCGGLEVKNGGHTCLGNTTIDCGLRAPGTERRGRGSGRGQCPW
jgi:hypothetical protein